MHPAAETDGRPNPQMVALARESRGLTQSELARFLIVSQGYLSKVEAGLLVPTDDILARLSSALDYPVSFFYLADPTYGPGVTEFWHRKRQAATSRDLRRIYAEINKRVMHVSRLLRGAEIPEGFPRFDLDEYESPEEIARAVRAAWNLPSGPIQNLIQAVESAGGLVIRMDFGTRLVDAVSRWVPGLPPLFFLNADLVADRERLTLAHEIGHIVMHKVPTPTMEDEAFRFAGELLMPERQIRPMLRALTLPRLATLKLMWRVSMAAIVTQAARIGAITKNQERYLWIQIGRAGYRQREPVELDFPKEPAGLLHELLDLHRTTLGYSISDLSQWFAVYERELLSAYPLTPTADEGRRHLRAIAN
ncbi:MAG: ImmA/IrrE family metallo-endopeptidase [Chloroflexi bacterium]|nr:ImmA/IrrE family metallo-endopeptidase [Chloroflexota bacterium]